MWNVSKFRNNIKINILKAMSTSVCKCLVTFPPFFNNGRLLIQKMQHHAKTAGLYWSRTFENQTQMQSFEYIWHQKILFLCVNIEKCENPKDRI